MNRALGKILFVLSITAQLALGQILIPIERKFPEDIRVDFTPVDSCNDRLVCQSNNDPHMVNFWNQPFEFQYEVKDQCLHQTSYVQVNANFNQCPSPWTSAKCNCAVKIILLISGEQAFIDNCPNNSVNPTDVLSFSSSPDVHCEIVSNPLFNPFDESDWILLPVTTGNSFFLCAIVNSHTYIKTKLSSTYENVIVEIFPGMSSLYVHASKSYTAAPTINRKCLCENKKDFLTEHHANLALQLPAEIDRCKSVLLNTCFIKLLGYDFLTAKRIEEIEKLIVNCALDLKESKGEGDIGAFQQNEIQHQIDSAILEALPDPTLNKIINEFCICQLKIDRCNMNICKRLNIKF